MDHVYVLNVMERIKILYVAAVVVWVTDGRCRSLISHCLLVNLLVEHTNLQIMKTDGMFVQVSCLLPPCYLVIRMWMPLVSFHIVNLLAMFGPADLSRHGRTMLLVLGYHGRQTELCHPPNHCVNQYCLTTSSV